MDEDRKQGAIKKTVGKVKEKAGGLIGDRKIESEGRAQRIEGDIQNTVGGIKDTLRDGDKH